MQLRMFPNKIHLVMKKFGELQMNNSLKYKQLVIFQNLLLKYSNYKLTFFIILTHALSDANIISQVGHETTAKIERFYLS